MEALLSKAAPLAWTGRPHTGFFDDVRAALGLIGA
jgi:hypothetical protein